MDELIPTSKFRWLRFRADPMGHPTAIFDDTKEPWLGCKVLQQRHETADKEKGEWIDIPMEWE